MRFARAVRLTALAALGALVFLSWPIAMTVDGVGVVQPVFERQVRITPSVDGMVSRLDVTVGQRVEPGATLLAYVPAGQWSVLVRGSLVPGRGQTPIDAAPPDWYVRLRDARIARVSTANRWQAQVGAPGAAPRAWERSLASRLVMLAVVEGDLAHVSASKRANEEEGRPELNEVHVADPAGGASRAARRGHPLASPVAGTVSSLWATTRLQISPFHPVGEITPDGVPIEILGLVPEVRATAAGLTDHTARIEALDGRLGSPAPLIGIPEAVGRIGIEAADARLLVPALPIDERAVFVRVGLRGVVAGSDLGRPVRFRLSTGLRPRIWLWILRGARALPSGTVAGARVLPPIRAAGGRPPPPAAAR